MEMRIGNSITPRMDWPIISSHALRGIRFIVNCGLEQELDFQRTICLWVRGIHIPANLGWINDIRLSGEVIWIATPDGLVYYDRLTETAAKLNRKDGLPENWVNAISINGDSLWVGTRSGLVKLKDLSDPQPQATKSLRSLTEATLGTPLGESGACFDEDLPFQVSHLTHPMAHANVVAVKTGGEEIWLCTPDGLGRYDWKADRWTVYTRENTNGGLPANNVTSISITETDVWIGTIGGVCRFNKTTQRWTKHVASRTTEVLHANRVAHLQEDGDFIWFGNWKETTEGAIGQYNRVTERFRFFSKDDLPLQPNAPPITLVHGITTDDKAVWFSTNAGVLRYNKLSDTWRHYSTQDGLPNNEVWSITPDGKDIWTLHIGGRGWSPFYGGRPLAALGNLTKRCLEHLGCDCCRF